MTFNMCSLLMRPKEPVMGGAWKRNCHQVKAKHDERAFVNLKGKEAKPSIPTLNNSTFSLLPSFLFPFSLSLCFSLPPSLSPSLPTDNHLLHTALHHFEVLHTDHLEHIVRKHSRNVLFSTLGRWVAAVCKKMFCKVCTPQ